MIIIKCLFVAFFPPLFAFSGDPLGELYSYDSLFSVIPSALSSTIKISSSLRLQNGKPQAGEPKVEQNRSQKLLFVSEKEKLVPSQGQEEPSLNKIVPSEETISQKIESTVELDSDISDKQDMKEDYLSVHLESEGRLSKNQISKNQSEPHPYIPYTELGFRYFKDDKLNFFANLGLESYKKEWQVGLGELSLSYSLGTIPFSVKAGWFPLPLGYMDENDHIFSQALSVYDSLSRNREDMGLILDLAIWKEFFSLRAGRFGGWFYREWDDFYKAPELAPFLIAVHSHGFFWDAFFSWFKKDLAFSAPLQSWGAGVQLKTSHKKWAGSIQSEFWWIEEEGQSTLAYYVFPSLTLYKLQMGVMFGNINRFFPDFKTNRVQSSVYEKVFQVSYHLHPNVLVIGERFISAQRKGISVKDLWTVRVKILFDWSKRL